MVIQLIKMKTIQLVIILFFAVGISQAKASTGPIEHETNPTNDTSAEVKNNVVIFKLIPTPITSNSSNNTSSGSLKKAGKVARTSYSHSTSIENIIYKKKGI